MLLFDSNIQNKHGVLCRGFLLSGKTPSHAWESEMPVRNNPQEDSNSVNNGLERMIYLGLQEGFNQRSP